MADRLTERVVPHRVRTAVGAVSRSMADRSPGHAGLCLALIAFGCYVAVSYVFAVLLVPVDSSLPPASLGWVAAVVGLAIVTGALGVVAGVSLWRFDPSGRRLGFAFVLGWVLTELLAIWGYLAGPAIAALVVADPMAPPFRLWIALSVGLVLWGWADGYVDGPTGTEY